VHLIISLLQIYRIEVILEVERIASDHVRGSGNLRRDPRTFKIRRTL
jgi:hypothetical protein